MPPSDYGAPAGDPELREAIAGYLRRWRGVACGAGDVVVTAGAIQAVDLIARAIIEPGDTVGFEEPGYPLARQALQARGAKLLPVQVNHDGMQVDLIPSGPGAPIFVYVTPSHQYPLGARMPVGRRMALLEWARANDALVVEDDYDSVFRFDAPPLQALAGLDDGGRVAYIGTFSKVLSPALRVGYLVVPPPLRERVEHFKRISDFHASWPLQRALPAFVREGHLERHIRRMRRHCGDKRQALSATLAPVSDVARPRGLEAGLHEFLELDATVDPVPLSRAGRDRQHRPPVLHARQRPGLLLGYGGLTIDEINAGGRVLAATIRAAAAG
ncbi:MAG TPA: PLP-dependent aminotransferase family protein [Thermomicrobiales bacterium]|nr:PLP-dependent aminotransferase family protein [Thermomicrobiales bacterium]